MKNINWRSVSILFLIATGLAVWWAMPFGSYAGPAPSCTNTVQNLNDAGPGSLREALATATNGETITFCPGLSGNIMVISGALVVSSNVTILGPGANMLAVSGPGPSRLFYISSNTVVTISGLAIKNGLFPPGPGAGIYNDHATLTVSNCLISGNVASDGAGIYNDGRFGSNATLNVINSTLTGNNALHLGGGAIFNDGQFLGSALVTVMNSTLSSNSAAQTGSAIYNIAEGSALAQVVVPLEVPSPASAVVRILNSTISSNSAPLGGGIFNNGLMQVGSTILKDTSIFRGFGLIASLGYNLSSDNGGGFLTQPTDQINTDPLLGPLQNNGGPTPTHAPLCGSPAIDQGTNFTGSATDQRGAPRTYDLPGVSNAAGGDGTDIGAVESPVQTFTVLNTNDSGAGSLRQAILDANASGGIDIIDFAPSAYGSITLTNGELLISDCLIVAGPGATNDAVSGNGASRVFDIAPGNLVTIAGLTITKGSADTGAAIHNDHSTLTVSNCTLIGNSAATYGGAIYNEGLNFGGAVLAVVNSTLAGNSAGGSGGGLLSYAASGGSAAVTVDNSTISSNSAYAGGGLNTFGLDATASLKVRNCTLSGNSATVGGNIVNNGSQVEVGSTILQTGSSGGNNSGGFTSLGYNLSSDDGGGLLNQPTDLTNSDPMLGPLQLNGGETPTHAFSCSSPAVDAGTNFAGLATDQRGDGFPRTVGSATDIGAFELQQICNQPPVALCTNVTVSADSNCVANASIDGGSYDPDAGDSITNRVQTPPGPYFLGTNDVTLTVTDSHGATNSCQGTVIVVDTTPPEIISCATAVTNSADANCQAPVPDFTTNVVAQDNCPLSGQLTFSQSPSAGTLVSLGTTNVTIFVADPSGNTNTCLTTFTVVDTTPPTIHCSTNIVAANDSGQCSAVVNFTVSADDNCSSVTLSEDFPSGSTFSKGTNSVTVTAVDSAGNTNTCSFTVTVLDQEPPLVACFPAPNPSGKISPPGKNGGGSNPSGYYQVLAKDNCDPAPTIYIKDTGSSFVAGPFKNGDIVRLKHAGATASSVPGAAPVVAVISLKGNGLNIAKDADGNVTPDSAGCVMQVK